MSDYNPLTTTAFPVADPDLELKGGGGVQFPCPAGFSHFCHFFFVIQNTCKGWGGGGWPRPLP